MKRFGNRLSCFMAAGGWRGADGGEASYRFSLPKYWRQSQGDCQCGGACQRDTADSNTISAWHTLDAQGIDPAAFRSQWERAIPTGRFGDSAEFSAACAFLCGAHASYITGQNLLIDGGAYPGTF